MLYFGFFCFIIFVVSFEKWKFELFKEIERIEDEIKNEGN